MSCGTGGKKKFTWTGDQVGFLNFVGTHNYMAGGPPGSNISASTTVEQFIPDPANRRIWLRNDAKFNDQLLDAAYPTIALQWIAEIHLDIDVVFRVSNQAFYVQDENGNELFYDARAERPPTIQYDLGEWLSPHFKIGDVTLVLNNRDGFYNQYLPGGALYKQWTGAKVFIKVGFGTKLSNYFTLFEGNVSVKQGLTATRDQLNVLCHDKFDIDEKLLPPRVYSSDNFPDISTEAAGKPIPLLYGDWTVNVPYYGSVVANCTNALEVEPAAYNFKISDTGIQEIDSVWLHRAERTHEKPDGPILIADNILSIDVDTGEFSLRSDIPVLDEPSVLVNRAKCGPGSAVNIITSNTDLDFIARGVKVGDRVKDKSSTSAVGSGGNLKFTARSTGTAPPVGAIGNTISVHLVTGPQYSDPKAVVDPIVTVSGRTITVAIPTKPDSQHPGQYVSGPYTANAIKKAIGKNATANDLVKTTLIGTVPAGYPPTATIGDVNQTIPSTISLGGGQDANEVGVIQSVANYQLVVSGNIVFAEGQEYSITTVRYTYIKSDKFSVVCKGKQLNNISVTRLADISPLIRKPFGVAFDFDLSYWITDDATQKIYNVDFKGNIINSFTYASIDPALVSISSLAVSNDNKLWFTDPTRSQVYRFNKDVGTVAFSFNTNQINGINATLANITGITLMPDNTCWIVDQATGTFYRINFFVNVTPFVTQTFNRTQFDNNATDIQDLSYDASTDELVIVDRNTGFAYRLARATGLMNSYFALSNVADNATYVSGVSVAQDGSLFFVDAGTLSVYNYNDQSDASDNVCFIARDLLQKFAGHTYDEFDLSWNYTAKQLSGYACRVSIQDKTTLVTYIGKLLQQFNIAFFQKFGLYSLFWINFSNFRTTGKLVKEKDVKEASFKPNKETNQYFNSVIADYQFLPFTGKTVTSDNYICPNAVAFAGREVNKKLTLPALYRRTEVDKLMPLYVKLSAPEPEFLESTFGFRILRTQMQDFLNVTFDDDEQLPTARTPISGRRYTNVPCMVRKIKYNLETMSVELKIWSLATTAFPGFTPTGPAVGGFNDRVLLTNLGRVGRVSAIGTITSAPTNKSVQLADADGSTAALRSSVTNGLVWQSGFKVDVINGATKAVVQTLTIDTVVGQVVTFKETFAQTILASAKNAAGFINAGHFIQYSTYSNSSEAQKKEFASFTRPVDDYPRSRSQELAEQRGGFHSFLDGGLPYVLYPAGYQAF